MKKILAHLLLVSIWASPELMGTNTNLNYNPLKKIFEQSILGGAIGDAMGRPTEFIKTLEKIYKKYPDGINSFDDFKDTDFLINKTGHKYVPYTDDSRMSILVLQALTSQAIKPEKERSLDSAMNSIAHAFVADVDKENGWATPHRAPGFSCMIGVETLRKRIENNKENESFAWYNPLS